MGRDPAIYSTNGQRHRNIQYKWAETQEYTVQMGRDTGIYSCDPTNKVSCIGRNPSYSRCLGHTQAYYSKPEQRLSIKQ